MTSTLKFVPLQSHVDISFWSELGKRKLEVYKLSEEGVEINGFCSICRRQSLSTPVSFDRTSFDLNQERQASFRLTGELYVVNSMERFKSFDRKAAVEHSVEVMKKTIEDGQLYDAATGTLLLQRFVLLTYADLKNHEYVYWFSFPALVPSSPYTSEIPVSLSAFNDRAQSICKEIDDWLQENDGHGHPVLHCGNLFSQDVQKTFQFIHTIDDLPDSELTACLMDPCHQPKNPSWLLRNILAFFAHHKSSSLLSVSTPKDPQRLIHLFSLVLNIHITKEEIRNMTSVSGWEANHLGKISPRKVNLQSHFDPKKLAEEAVGLNIRLMLWRAAPDLKLDAF